MVLVLVLISIILGTYMGYLLAVHGNYSDEVPKEIKNQLAQLQNQNLRCGRELRILNKKYRRSRLLNKKFQKERDVLKLHVGPEAINIIKALYPEGNLNYLAGERSASKP